MATTNATSISDIVSGGVTRRTFDDVDSIRNNIYDSTLNALKTRYPLENSRYRLELTNLKYANRNPYTIEQQKQALLAGKTLSHRIHGSWNLVDKETGKPVDTRSNVVMHVPYLTNRGTFIHRGNEYGVANQMRLRPGVYTRRKENKEIESHFNVLPGTGTQFRVFMDPSSGVFFMRAGQSKIPLFPVLRGLGVSERQMRDTWGNELYQVNALKDNPVAVKTAYQKLAGSRAKLNGDAETHARGLRETLEKAGLDPDVTEATLGKRYERITPDVILHASKKLMQVSRGEADTDDRDSLAYQSVHGLEDFFRERIEKDAGRLGQGLLWRATYRGDLSGVPSGALSKQTEQVLLKSGLGQPLEEINPLEVYDQLNKISRMGEGGIPSMDSVPEEARNVQPSYFGYIDGIRSPESGKIGVDSRIAYGTMKGSDGKLYTNLTSLKTGKTTPISAADATKLTIAFPGEVARAKATGKTNVRAMRAGKIEYINMNEVDYELPGSEEMFSSVTSMVPVMSSNKADRVSMGSRMQLQALALQEAEAPFLRSSHPGGASFEEKLGTQMGAIRAAKPGTVTSIRNNIVTVKNDDGTKSTHELYHNFPFNRKSFIHSTPMVQPGDRVEQNSLIAKSNFTDDTGVSALGRNMRVAYMPYEGANYEDAVVISESAAKKLTSEHMYQEDLDTSEEDMTVGRRGYQALFSAKYPAKIFENFEDNGVIKPGTVVNEGDPLILSMKKTKPKGKGVHTRLRSPFTDAAVTWDHSFPGEVTDVFKDGKNIRVAVKAYSPAQVGDKMANRYGGKGVIAKIIPDDEMVKDSEGRPIELMLNPLGIISRGNPIQLIETALGKIARKTGKSYTLPGFSEDDHVEFALKELAKHGMSDTEDLDDPKRNAKLKNIFTGEQFFMKLHHSAEGKASGRSVGSYTADEIPARGGAGGSKRVGTLELNALISHGATDTLRDIKTVRGTKNDDFWRAFRLGYPAPTPDVPFVYKKLQALMQAAGINMHKQGEYNNIMAMVDDDVKSLSKGEIRKPETLDFDSMDPIPGGLFDLRTTGGNGGTKWSHYKLSEVMPNPVMEEPIRRLLGLTKAKFEDVMSGKEELFGRSGGAAIEEALKRIKVDDQIELQKEIIRSGAKSKRDDAVKKLQYLDGSKKTGIHPSKWMLNNVPILPPVFRPISRMGKTQLISDPNHLYRELMLADENLQEYKSRDLDPGAARLTTYKAFKAVTGLGDPLQPKLQEKNVKGMLKHIFGTSPKTGFFQHKVMGSAVDTVGRGVITPNPALNMDQVGLPESQAWEIYRNFVIRNMVRRGSSATDAVKQVMNKSETAKKALLEEIGKRPLVITRAPVLHKFGVMAAWPVLTSGDTLQISPIVVPGFCADFDGDTMNYHVPVSDEAVEEAQKKMLPSKNLLNVSQFDVEYVPQQEYLHGLYVASREKKSKKPLKYFKSKKDVIAAYNRGELDIDDPVKIIGGK